MSFPYLFISWDYQQTHDELIEEAQRLQADYVIATSKPDSMAVVSSIHNHSAANLIVICDSISTERWSRLQDVLPPEIYFLAVAPSFHSAVAISVAALESQKPMMTQSTSLNDFFFRMARDCQVAYSKNVHVAASSRFRFPHLTQTDGKSCQSWTIDSIKGIPNSHSPITTSIAALRAGLYLVNDGFDDSHRWSQSIEGQGALRTGDYWHAILHRREPDYGNAKYWFRHVGQYPTYFDLSQIATRYFNESQSSLAAKLKPWTKRIVRESTWDPFAFIDLCQAAEKDAELMSWCERLQYDEMILLMESTAREVFKPNMK